jgi:small subunit ribosomal protein S17e
MGRIRTTYVKRVTRQLLEKFPNRFSKDFNEDKKVMNEIADVPSKKIRNKVAGSIGRTLKHTEE